MDCPCWLGELLFFHTLYFDFCLIHKLVYLGRFLVAYIPQSLLNLLANPSAVRTDVILNDLYSFSAGLLMISLLSHPISFLILLSKRIKNLDVLVPSSYSRPSEIFGRARLAGYLESWNELVLWIVSRSIAFTYLAAKAVYLVAALGFFLPYLFAMAVAQYSLMMKNGNVVSHWSQIEYYHAIIGILSYRLLYLFVGLGAWPSIQAALDLVYLAVCLLTLL